MTTSTWRWQLAKTWKPQPRSWSSTCSCQVPTGGNYTRWSRRATAVSTSAAPRTPTAASTPSSRSYPTPMLLLRSGVQARMRWSLCRRALMWRDSAMACIGITVRLSQILSTSRRARRMVNRFRYSRIPTSARKGFIRMMRGELFGRALIYPHPATERLFWVTSTNFCHNYFLKTPENQKGIPIKIIGNLNNNLN